MENHLLLHPKAIHLPIVFPIVFYNGTQKPYPYGLNILDLFYDSNLALKTLIEPAHLVDITQMSDEDLKKHKIIGLLEWSQKHIRDKDLGTVSRLNDSPRLMTIPVTQGCSLNIPAM